MKTAFRQIRVIHCAVVKSNHARGLYGFHDSPSCPDCQKIDEGFRVHDGDSIFAPFVGYNEAQADTISPHPIYVIDSTQNLVANCDIQNAEDGGRANAALIAAAPELLAALEQVANLRPYGPNLDETPEDGEDAMRVLNWHIRNAREVLARAKGGQ